MITIFSKIVVPFDGSDLSKKAVEAAIILAKQDEKIELDILTVMNIPPSLYLSVHPYGVGNVREGYESAAKEQLQQVEESLKPLSNKTQTVLLEGNPAHAIVEYIKEKQADFVVMGSRGLSGLEEMFLGSVSHYVVQKSPCPVLIVK